MLKKGTFSSSDHRNLTKQDKCIGQRSFCLTFTVKTPINSLIDWLSQRFRQAYHSTQKVISDFSEMFLPANLSA